jgi:penicillin-binding protein 1C
VALGALLGAAAWQVAVRVRPYPRALLEPAAASSLTVLDADGRVLRQVATGAGGRESWVPLDRISAHLQRAVVISEDRRFEQHGGVDPVGVARALWLDLRARRLAYGGSTLTMQLVRLIEPHRRDLWAKAREALLAQRLERIASKHEILEQYLNRVYYGNGAWGAQAAAALYFGKPAAALSLGEAALLASLPRGPAAYDPYRNLDRALARRAHVLGLMEKAGAISAAERALAERTPLALRRDRPDFRAPHFVDHVLAQLGAGAQAGASGGATVHTTLDGPLQERLEVAVREHLAAVGGRHLTQAGVVVLRNSDGAVLAMVGSRDYFDAEHDGAVNVTTIRRRPGSSLKPFVYGLAVERGDSPATLAYDVILPRDQHESWAADVRQHGFARYRESLAGSYNLAAVHTLERVGVNALLERLRRAGLDTLDWPDERYALNLAIGEAEVRVVDLAAAYAAFGTGGTAVIPRAITEVERPGRAPDPRPPAAGPRLFAPDVAYLIYDILSDPDARRPMFGSRVPMVLPFPVALKTGTTRAYTDTLAFGVTREYTVGAWGGNFDGSPTAGMMAMQGAAPLVRAAFVALAARFGDPTAPPRPDGLVEAEVCPLSGMAPGPACPLRKRELFRAGTVPRARCNFHVLACGHSEVRYPPEVAGWARVHGLLHPSPCRTDGVRAPEPRDLRILSPTDGAHFVLDPFRAPDQQLPPLRAAPTGPPVRWTIDGVAADHFKPTAGPHHVRAVRGDEGVEVTIEYD